MGRSSLSADIGMAQHALDGTLKQLLLYVVVCMVVGMIMGSVLGMARGGHHHDGWFGSHGRVGWRFGDFDNVDETYASI